MAEPYDSAARPSRVQAPQTAGGSIDMRPTKSRDVRSFLRPVALASLAVFGLACSSAGKTTKPPVGGEGGSDEGGKGGSTPTGGKGGGGSTGGAGPTGGAGGSTGGA